MAYISAQALERLLELVRVVGLAANLVESATAA